MHRLLVPLSSILPNSHYKVLDLSLMGGVLKLLPYIVHVTDCETGKLLFLGKNLVEILGYDGDGISANAANSFAESVDAFKAEYNTGQEIYQHTYKVEHKNGDVLTINTRSMVYRRDTEGKPVEILGMSEDITEKVKIEEEKQRMHQLLSEAENMMGFGSWSWKINEDKVIWSDGLYRILGFNPADREQLEIDVPKYYDWVHPDDLEGLKKSNEAFLSTGVQQDDYQHRIITQSGEEKILVSKAKVIVHAEDGKTPVLAMGSTYDATYLKTIQKELEKQVLKLDLSNRDLEQFAYVASHDLQEPLRKIVAFGERLKSTLGDDMGDKPTLYLDRMLNAAGRMRELINNLLSLSRLTSDQPFETIDLNAFVLDIQANIEIGVEETDAIISIDDLPTITGIPAQLSQLFNNLLSNSLKFRKENEAPKISIQTAELTSDETEKYGISKNDFHKILVRDNGIGFANEYAEQIFTVFKRLHGRTEYAGTGIGLAICRKVTDNHQGFIYANSEADKGTTFTILLPKNQTELLT